MSENIMSNDLTIHDRIEKIADFQNLTINAFAKKINTASSVIYNIVKGRPNGTKSKPSFEILNKVLLTFTDVDAHWLMTGKGDMLIQHKHEDGEYKEKYYELLEKHSALQERLLSQKPDNDINN